MKTKHKLGPSHTKNAKLVFERHSTSMKRQQVGLQCGNFQVESLVVIVFSNSNCKQNQQLKKIGKAQWEKSFLESIFSNCTHRRPKLSVRESQQKYKDLHGNPEKNPKKIILRKNSELKA